jgi:triosephosphate isomerase (TIM)
VHRQLVAANWKMYGSSSAVEAYIEALLAIDLEDGPTIVFCPPFPYLPLAVMLTAGSPIAVGAQNCHWDESGAFTGEVAAEMLAEVGVRWVVNGHSERRRLFGESDESATRRAQAAQRAGLNVIFCVGETLEQRDGGETFAVLERQSASLGGLAPGSLVVAYEPVWAIGTGRNASPEQAQEAHAFLRSRLAAQFGATSAREVRLLYGGSVKPENAGALFSQPDVDGGLIGGASLDPAAFSAIIRSAPARRA